MSKRCKQKQSWSARNYAAFVAPPNQGCLETGVRPKNMKSVGGSKRVSFLEAPESVASSHSKRVRAFKSVTDRNL